MTPILGIIASSNFRVPTAYESIATVTVGSGGSASISFTSIPSTFTHLQIRAIVRKSTADTLEDAAGIRFNSDSASNYSFHNLIGNGSATSTYSGATQTYATTIDVLNNSNTANAFSAGIIDILDYANTNKYKTVRTLSGWDANGSGQIWFSSGSWRNTAAITSLTLAPNVDNYVQYSSFALYGIRG
jgi:hypothetical protein